MKHDWEWRDFETCIEKIVYTKKIQSSDYLSEGKYPIVSQEDGLISGYWNGDEDIFKLTKPIVIFGDHTRVLKYVDFDFVLGADGVKILQPIESIMAKFLYYYLRWLNIPSLGYSRHYKLLKECSVPVPPLAIQEQIVAELDKVSEIIEKKKQQVKELDNLAQSIFYDMFGDPVENEKGWEVKRLEDIVRKDCPISYGIVQPGDGVECGVPVVRPVDMIGTFVKLDGLKKTTVEISNSYKRTILKGDEILMCVRGTTGLVSLVTQELIGANVTRGITPIECNDKYNRWFIYFQFKSKGVQDYIANYTKGIALKQINMKDVRAIPLVTPPLALQQSFAQKIETIEKQKELITASIKEMQTLFDSRMEYYFG